MAIFQFPHQRREPETVPVEQALQLAHQLGLPLNRDNGIVYFGGGRYVAIGTFIRRVEA